jgi:hypothetical protein
LGFADHRIRNGPLTAEQLLVFLGRHNRHADTLGFVTHRGELSICRFTHESRKLLVKAGYHEEYFPAVALLAS